MRALRARRGALQVGAVVAVGVVTCCLALTGVAAAALPDGRVIERVSQANTNGNSPLDIEAATAQIINDDNIWFGAAATPTESSSSGWDPVFAASRGPEGWNDTSLSPPGANPYLRYAFVDATRATVGGEDGVPVASVFESIRTLIFEGVPASEQPLGLFYRNSEGQFTAIVEEAPEGRPTAFAYGGMSAAGQTVVYQADNAEGTPQVYAWSPNGAIKQLSTGTLSECGAHTMYGAVGHGGESVELINSVSESGEVAFMESAPSELEGCSHQSQVYVNDAGVVKMISAPSNGAPLPAEAPAADFEGATPNGQTAYFTSQGDLTPEASGEAIKLYQWSAGHGLSCVTCQAGVSVASGGGTVALSSDGLYVWIDSLSGGLYLYHEGKLQQAELPLPLQGFSSEDFSISPTGDTVAVKVADGTEVEAGIALTPLYRVSDSSGALNASCLTCLEGKFHSGRLGLKYSGPLFTSPPGASTISSGTGDSITSNGETVVFESPAALTPGVAKQPEGFESIYEWNAQRGVSLIAEESLYGSSITPDGSNIFFTSLQILAPDTTQRNQTLYDARVGGGFPEGRQPGESACAADSTCQSAGGVVSIPAPAAAAPAGNLPTKATQGQAATLGSIVLSRAQLASFERSGFARVRIFSRGEGTVSLAVSGVIAGHDTVLGRARAGSSAGGGELTLTLHLSRAARGALARSGRLKVTLTASLKGARRRHESFVLEAKRPRNRHGTKRNLRAPAGQVRRTVDMAEGQL